jgi:hypothetical protein
MYSWVYDLVVSIHIIVDAADPIWHICHAGYLLRFKISSQFAAQLVQMYAARSPYSAHTHTRMKLCPTIPCGSAIYPPNTQRSLNSKSNRNIHTRMSLTIQRSISSWKDCVWAGKANLQGNMNFKTLLLLVCLYQREISHGKYSTLKRSNIDSIHLINNTISTSYRNEPKEKRRF